MSFPFGDNFTKEEFLFEFPCSSDKIGKIDVFAEIDSTNAHLLRTATSLLPLLTESGTPTSSGAAFDRTVALAASQTAGRGRLGRTFFSPDASGVYFSFALVPTGGIKDPASFTATAAVGVCRALEGLSGEQCQIKWVNDIFCRGKKVCGILSEGVVNPQSQQIEAVVVGIGINILPSTNIPHELRESAGALCDERFLNEHHITRMKVASRCVKEIFTLLDAPSCSDVLQEYKRRSLLIDKSVTVFPVIGEHKSFTARVLDVAGDFSLVVELENGTQKLLHSGEVSLHQG